MLASAHIVLAPFCKIYLDWEFYKKSGAEYGQQSTKGAAN